MAVTPTPEGTIAHLRDSMQQAQTDSAAIASEATHRLTQAGQQAMSALSQTMTATTATVSHTASAVVNQVQSATTQAASQIAQTAATAKHSFGQTLSQPDHLPTAVTPSVSDRIQTAVFGSLQGWLAAHPMVHWSLTHPLYALGIGLLILFLLWGLLRAIVHLADRAWLAILQAPCRLSRWLWSRVQLLPAQAQAESEPHVDPQVRLTEILSRLDALRQEQDTLMQEVKTILMLEKPSVNGDS